MHKNGKNIVLLCSDGDSTKAVYQALRSEFGKIIVIMEDDIPKSLLVKRRIKKLGLFPVFGQLLFMSAVVPVLRFSGKNRIKELKETLKIRDIEDEIIRIDSVNSESGRAALQSADPELVVVNGTRIISKETLQCVNAKFVNMHAGITPLYRGVHGGYWALLEKNANLVGTTIHFVDTGIDTGNIIEQAFFEVSPADNFATYPYLHTKAGIDILVKNIKLILDGNLEGNNRQMNLPSKLRYHPTIWQYIYHYIKQKVR